MNRQRINTKDVDVGVELSKIFPLLIREFAKRQSNFFAKGVLTVPQVVILDYLAERGPCKMNELAKVLNVTMSAVTPIVDKMIKLKLVKRERSTEDRRVVKIIMLNQGKEKLREIREERKNIMNDFFSVLTKSEKYSYVKLLKKVYNNLKQRDEK
jgi:DNA-binding MarR family transcriptional regulator